MALSANNATRSMNKLSPKAAALPAVALALAAFLLFYSAFRFSLPIGYAGLYAQASEQIAQANFRLPDVIHFYGPGDIPFAYPPLAMYAMALSIKIGISPTRYMRFIPPLLSLLALVPLYLLAERASRSRFAALVAAGICAASPALIAAHTSAAGIVRALGFLLLLCGFYIFERAVEQGSLPLSVLAGLFFGLVGLTHLFYALFFALWAGCWIIAKPNLRSIKAGAICVSVGALIAAPWIGLVMYRHGSDPFLNAFLTHGNTSFLHVLTGRQDLTTWITGKLDVVTAVPFLILFVVSGFIWSVASREFGMPLAFLMALLVLSPEGGRFIIILAAILAGTSIGCVRKWLPSVGWAHALSLILLGLIGGVAVLFGFHNIQRIRPDLREGALAVGQYIENHTSPGSRFLLMAGPNEAEWFPYLLQRRPLASKWGAEWLATYGQQSGLVSSINYCHRTQDLGCIRDLNLPMESTDVLLTLKGDKQLSAELEALPACPQMAAIGQYLVWQAGCLAARP
jgi:hypothetical protein